MTEELQAEGLARSALEGEEALAEYLVSAGFGDSAVSCVYELEHKTEIKSA